jgi:sugar (pentulose or hexulose) kinase
MVTDALNCELAVPTWGETSSLGAAFWGLIGTGAIPNLEAIPALVAVQDHFVPGKAEAEAYRSNYRLYSDLYQVVSPLFRTLAELKVNFREGMH